MAYTTINKSTDHFNTKLYTGNGSTQSITGVGFQPDWVWIKRRDSAASHELHDAVRGATKRLKSDATTAEYTDASTLTSFDSDGFSLGSGSLVNTNSASQVSWNWKANGQGSSNTDGSINTTYTSVNTTAGFSIVKWTGNGSDGATIGHGLGAVPKMVIVKSTSNAENWNVYHEDITSADNGNFYLNSNSAYANSGGNRWARSSISSSVFGLGSDGTTNGSGQTYIAYCFTEKIGFSKFGIYTGNANADGPFVYTGFKPAFVLIRGVSTTDWNIFDNKRYGFNGKNNTLFANLTNAQDTEYNRIDFLSNGFKIINTAVQVNNNNTTHLYMAFAEAPLVGSNNVPCTAR